MLSVQQMGKYLTNDQLDTIIEILNADEGSIWERRNTIQSEFNIDILDSGDSLSTIRTSEYIKSYDPSYNPNFHRNGVDAVSDLGDIEQKTTRVDLLTPTGLPKKQPFNAQWTFHAVANYEERYIFVVMDKETWTPVRIYDIANKVNVDKVIARLEEQRQVYLSGIINEGKSAKNDRIGISELFIRGAVDNFVRADYQQCSIYKD